MTERMDGRALRLKTLGNAVCPPQAYPIFHYIAAIETGDCVSICPKGFKSRTIYYFRHIASPTYIVYFIFR